MGNWQRFVFIFGMIGSVQFIVFSFIAMIFYPGGYSFFSDPLSALGYTRVDGQSNFISFIFFNPSMFLVGVSVVGIFSAMRPFFQESEIQKGFALAGSLFALFSGIAMCGAALTPGDINYEAHVAFAPFTFLFGILMVAFFLVSMILKKDFPKQYTFASILYVIFIMISLILLIFGPSYETNEGIRFQTTVQKIAIYAEILILLLLSYGGLQFLSSRELKNQELST
jgi:hypothetical protein